MKNLYLILLSFFSCLSLSFGQQQPVNCDLAIPGCTTPSFPINGTNPPYDVQDFGTGTVSNPSTNPNPTPGNMGCLLSGETVSTFITLNITVGGTLEWFIQGPSGGFFDWIMWQINPSNGYLGTCSLINSDNYPPVACNWNASYAGYTGMAAPGNLPPGAVQGNFEYALNVNAGDQFIICLSNFSSTNQTVNFTMFGTAQCDFSTLPVELEGL